MVLSIKFRLFLPWVVAVLWEKLAGAWLLQLLIQIGKCAPAWCWGDEDLPLMVRRCSVRGGLTAAPALARLALQLVCVWPPPSPPTHSLIYCLLPKRNKSSLISLSLPLLHILFSLTDGHLWMSDVLYRLLEARRCVLLYPSHHLPVLKVGQVWSLLLEEFLRPSGVCREQIGSGWD